MKLGKNIILFLSLFAVTALNIADAVADINLGIIAPRGELRTKIRWNNFAEYLTAQIGQPVRIVALPARKVIDAVENEKVDILLLNPVLTAKIEKLYGANMLATVNKTSGSVFAGVIVAKRGNGIKTGTDLKNKKVMSLKFRAAAGAYTFQTYHLMQQGVNPHKDFKYLRPGKKQDDLIIAVNAGIIDAAFVRSGILEEMKKEGKINVDDFVIVDQHEEDEVPFLHTTSHYPEWFLFALEEVDSKLAMKIKKAVMAIRPNDEAAKSADILGFVKPLSLDSIKAALTALRIAPFRK